MTPPSPPSKPGTPGTPGEESQANTLPDTGADDQGGLAILSAMMLAAGGGLVRIGKHRKA